MIEFGCHTWGFNDKSLDEVFGTVARLGFRYVDIGSGPHLDVVEAAAAPSEAADAIRRQLDHWNLQVSDLYLMLPRISVADDTRREHEINSFEALLPFAAALGTPGITVSPGVSQQGPPDAVIPRVADALTRFVAAAGEHNLPVSIEPHMDSVAETPEDALDLINQVDGLGITLDWAHMVKQGLKPDTAIPLLGRVRHVQARQAAPFRMQVPFEQGVLDLERVMTLLMSAGYDGVITVETMGTIGWHGAAAVNPVTEAVTLRDTLRALRDRFATH